MARILGRQKALVAASTVELAPRPPKSLIASSMRLDGQSWKQYRFGDQGWQEELWRLYDIVGEFRFVANWIGSALSRVRIYVANVDRNGRVQDEVKDPKIAALADNLFGNPSAKQEAMRMLGINLTVAGDAFVVGTGATKNGEADEWRVLSCSELKRYGGNVFYLYPDGTREKIDLERSIIFRIWTPHPRRTMWADSPARAAMPVLVEIERLTRYVFAQIDSRLISAGLLAIPKEMDFTDTDDELDLTGAEALTHRLMRTGAQSLKGDGTAAGVLPTIIEVPTEALGKLQLLQFTSELSQQAMALRTEAIRRFGLAMDIDPSILNGASDANHWGAWQINEGQIKVHIEPLDSRICDAATQAFLAPALKLMGKDPRRYAYAADTAPLTVRPQRLKDTMDMYKEGHVKRETVLIAGDYKESDLPTEEEDLQRFTRELMLRDPNLFQLPAVRKVAGYSDEILPPGSVTPPVKPGEGGAGPPPPPAPPTGIMGHELSPIPTETQAQNALGGPPAAPAGTPAGIVASASVPSPVTTFVVANAAVLRALEVAGKRLLTSETRGTLTDVPPFALHTRIPVNGVDHARRILAGSWDHLGVLVDHLGLSADITSLTSALHMYCLGLLVRGEEHHVNSLGETLMAQGYLDGQP